MPLIIGNKCVGLRNLVTKVEPRTQSTLIHIGCGRDFTIDCSLVSIEGISAMISGRCHQLQGTNRIATLQVRGNKFGLNGVVVCRTRICNHIDPVYRYCFQNLMYILILKFTSIHINDRILGNAMEIQSDTDNPVVASSANLDILQIYLAVIPAVTNRGQGKVNLITGCPALIDNIQRYPGIHILKLKICTELTASHIRQFCDSAIHLCGKADKAVGHSLIIIEVCLQRTS